MTTACIDRSPDTNVTVAGGHASIRLVEGRRWISPTTPAIAGTQVRRDSDALSAFVDTNRDGYLDPHAEPSTPCVREGERWRCEVEPRQIIVLREETASGKDTFVIPRWNLDDDDTVFCLGRSSGCERSWAPSPRSAAEIQTLSACSDEDLTLWIGAPPAQPLMLGARPPMDVRGEVRVLARGAVELTLRGDDVADRLFAWVGPESSPVWTSETSDRVWRMLGDHAVVEIPEDAWARCPACPIHVVVADHVRWRDDETSAMVLDVRERRLQFEVPAP